MDDEVCEFEELTIEEMAHRITEAFYDHNLKQALQFWYDYSDYLMFMVASGELNTIEMTEMHEQLYELVEHELTTTIRALELGLEVIK